MDEGVRFHEDIVQLSEVFVSEFDAGWAVSGGIGAAGSSGGVETAIGECGGGSGGFKADPEFGADLDFGLGADAIAATGEVEAFFDGDGVAGDVEIAEVEIGAGLGFLKAEVEGAGDDFYAGVEFEVVGTEAGVEGGEEGGGDLIAAGDFLEGVAGLNDFDFGEGIVGEDVGVEEDGFIEGGELGAEVGGLGVRGGEVGEGGVEGGAGFDDAAGVEGLIRGFEEGGDAGFSIGGKRGGLEFGAGRESVSGGDGKWVVGRREGIGGGEGGIGRVSGGERVGGFRGGDAEEIGAHGIAELEGLIDAPADEGEDEGPQDDSGGEGGRFWTAS